jgi:hypothetical protein
MNPLNNAVIDATIAMNRSAIICGLLGHETPPTWLSSLQKNETSANNHNNQQKNRTSLI